MLTKSIVLAALACSQALALPALAPRQASEASSAVASLTEAASSAVASATGSASSAAESVSSEASSASESASSAVESASSSASASASSSAPSASSSPASYASGLLAALRARQATGLASLIEGNPEIASAVGGLLGQTSQNFTLIAPSNSGLEEATSGMSMNDTAAIQNLLTYHILPGYYPADYFQTNQTVILNTALNQNLVFYRDQYETTQIVGGQNITILGNSTYQNVLIKLADGALMLPQNVSTTLANSEYGTQLVNTITSTAPDLVNTLDTAPMITVFAPSNQALSNIQDSLNSLAGDPMMLQQILLGHVVSGQTLYSNAGPGNLEMMGATAQSAAGTTLTFMKNGTGLYVESQGTTAQVTEANIITSNGMGMNGVVHVIDAVLVPAMASAAPSASSSASESASAVSQSASSALESASSEASGAVESATSAASGAAESATSAAAGAASSAMAAVTSAAAAATSA